MAEQAGGGTGEQVLNPAAGARQFRASCWGGARGCAERTACTRAASGLRLGILWSPARSWLTEPLGNCGLADVSGPKGRTESRIRKSRDGPESAARRRSENAAAERREARRPTSLAGDLRRSRDRADREAAHRVRRIRTSACRRSAPFIFSRRAEKRRRGTRPPLNGPAQRWLFAPASGNPETDTNREDTWSNHLNPHHRNWTGNRKRTCAAGSICWTSGACAPTRPATARAVAAASHQAASGKIFRGCRSACRIASSR